MNDKKSDRCFRVKLSEKPSKLIELAIRSLSAKHCRLTRSEFVSEIVEAYLSKYFDRDLDYFLDRFIDHKAYFNELAKTASRDDLASVVKKTRRQLNPEKSSHVATGS